MVKENIPDMFLKIRKIYPKFFWKSVWMNYDTFVCIFNFTVFYLPWLSVLLELPQIKYEWVVSKTWNLSFSQSGAGCRSSAGRVGFWWKPSLGLYLAPFLTESHMTLSHLCGKAMITGVLVLKVKLFMLHLLDMATLGTYSPTLSLASVPLMKCFCAAP